MTLEQKIDICLRYIAARDAVSLNEIRDEAINALHSEANTTPSRDADAENERCAMSKTLKPCPFCGGEATVEMDESWYWEWDVYCTKCGATFQTYFDKEQEAIEAWNRRAGYGQAD